MLMNATFHAGKKAEPLMAQGGPVLTGSYHGSERVVDHDNIVGPVKTALEPTARFLAAELGRTILRSNAMSPDPVEARATSGIDHFDALTDDAKMRAPLHRLTMIDDVGALSACLVSAFARSMSGSTTFVDGGHNVV